MNGLFCKDATRNRLYDNVITQDVYPSPAVVLVMRGEEKRLPFADETFDLVLLDNVLECVPEPKALCLVCR